MPQPLSFFASFSINTKKSFLFVSAFMLAMGSCSVAAESSNLLPLTVHEQIEALKKQNQEMHLQIEALRQQRWRTSSSRRAGGSASPQIVRVTSGKDSKADVQSLKQIIEAMNERS